MGVFIGVVLALAVMIVLFFFVFRGIVTRVGNFAQLNALRQTGVFDELIQSKEQRLENLNYRIEQARLALETEEDEAPAPVTRAAADLLSIPQGSYYDESFAEEYRRIRSDFRFDYGACVNSVLEKLPKKDGAAAAKKLLDEFTPDTVYQLATLGSDAQLEILKSSMDAAQLEVLNRYLEEEETEAFETYAFIAWLELYVFANSAASVVVRTGMENVSENWLSGAARVEYDKDICEGLYVVGYGKVYDFSIRSREIVG